MAACSELRLAAPQHSFASAIYDYLNDSRMHPLSSQVARLPRGANNEQEYPLLCQPGFLGSSGATRRVPTLWLPRTTIKRSQRLT